MCRQGCEAGTNGGKKDCNSNARISHASASIFFIDFADFTWTKQRPLCTQDNNMTRLDANVNIPPNRQWLHRGATGHQMLLTPADVNLSKISLKDSLLDRPAPDVLRRGRRLRRNPKMHGTH
jgi:hypothetical protein